PGRVPEAAARACRGGRLGGDAPDVALRAREVQRARDRRVDARGRGGSAAGPARERQLTMRRLLATAAVATVAFGVALAAGPHDRELAFVAYVDFLCALLLVGLARSICRPLPPQPRRGGIHAPPAAAAQIAQSDWLERQLRLAQASGDELHRYFRPIVVQIAAAQLVRKHGVVLERDPARARAFVGERLWELIRPERPLAPQRGRGLRPRELRRLVAELEELK